MLDLDKRAKTNSKKSCQKDGFKNRFSESDVANLMI